jgi:hypothetical protein
MGKTFIAWRAAMSRRRYWFRVKRSILNYLCEWLSSCMRPMAATAAFNAERAKFIPLSYTLKLYSFSFNSASSTYDILFVVKLLCVIWKSTSHNLSVSATLSAMRGGGWFTSTLNLLSAAELLCWIMSDSSPERCSFS